MAAETAAASIAAERRVRQRYLGEESTPLSFGVVVALTRGDAPAAFTGFRVEDTGLMAGGIGCRV
jgi:hypothetical protein